jgi:tetratricopeptide (TPR) repeat protein
MAGRLMFGSRHVRNTLLICILLAAGTFAAFWPVQKAGFVNLDDPTYVRDNLRVQKGLSGQNVKWAFQTFHFSNWHPVTWLSYMLDCQLFGANPTAMHRVNLGLHIANALLLFLVLRRMTGSTWGSGVVAALFALHPLHVESVAWISERKDVLSTFFWLLTMWAYTEYARRSAAGWYATALLFFTLGLMSKAMLVTLPLVLLLLDYWPLERMHRRGQSAERGRDRLGKLLVEKIPFFLLAALGSWLAFLAQRRGEAMTTFTVLPFIQRVENAFVSYTRYLGKTFWPADLAVFYPHPYGWSGLQVLGASVCLLTVSLLALRGWRRWPFLFTGWFWFLGTLVPVIGLVQVGGQSMADRYTYVPSIGLFIALVWSAREIIQAKRLPVPIPIGVTAAVLVSCAVITYRQAGYWEDSLTLFEHAASIGDSSAVVRNNLGDALLQHGKTNEANAQFRAALELDPEDFRAWGNLGNSFLREGKLEEAIDHYRNGLRYKANSAELHFNLATALNHKGNVPGAMAEYQQTIALKPDYLNAWLTLGNIHMTLGNTEAAITNYTTALAIKDDFAPAYYNLGNARLAQNRVEDAVALFSQAIRLDEQFGDAHRQLGVALEQSGKAQEALKHFERAVGLKPNDPGARARLAALLASLGRTEAAINQYREAIKLDPDMPALLNNLAWMLATHPEARFRNGAEAVQLAERAVKASERKAPMLLGTLAAAYAEAGRFDEAVKTAEEAIRLARSAGDENTAKRNEQLLEYYRSGKPWREPVRIPEAER